MDTVNSVNLHLQQNAVILTGLTGWTEMLNGYSEALVNWLHTAVSLYLHMKNAGSVK